MLERLLQLRSIAASICLSQSIVGLTQQQSTKLADISFSSHEWVLLAAIRDALRPFSVATTMLSGSYPTMSMLYFVLKTLRDGLPSSSRDTSSLALLQHSLFLQLEFYITSKIPAEQQLNTKVGRLRSSTHVFDKREWKTPIAFFELKITTSVAECLFIQKGQMKSSVSVFQEYHSLSVPWR